MPMVSSSELPSALRPLIEGVRSRNRLALGRAISLVEDERPGFEALLHALLANPGEGARVGLTGPPGAGKSSLVTALARAWTDSGEEVGIVAVDPTSPYSGGALLGDRIRMNELATHPSIFIRSMASRGSLGGLATTTTEVLDLLDASGFPRILVETVGVGQTELEIAGAADTVVVVLVPESGDGIQAMKAGLMEIADLFVVNKSDRPGADRLVRELRTALHYRAGDTGRMAVPAHHGIDLRRMGGEPAESVEPELPVEGPGPWTPPVLQTVAHAGEGIEELMAAIAEHRSWLAESGELEARRRIRLRTRVRDVMERAMKRRVRALLENPAELDPLLRAMEAGEETPYTAALHLLSRLGTP